MIPAPCVRAMAPPNARLPTLETKSLSGAAGSSAGSGWCSGARGFSCSWMRSVSLTCRGYGRACQLDARPIGPSVRAHVCSMMRHGRNCRKPAQGVGPRDRRGLAARLDGAARRRDPAGPVAQARASAPASARVVIGVALAIMIPRINDGKAERDARGRRRAGARAQRQPRARHQAPAAAHRRARCAQARRRRRRPRERRARASWWRASRPRSPPTPSKRAATGEISKVQGPTTCEHAAGHARRPARSASSTATRSSRKVPKVKTNVAGSIGYPFRAVVQLRDVHVRFCRTEQFPGEKLDRPTPRTVVQLPAACQARVSSAKAGGLVAADRGRNPAPRGERGSPMGFPATANGAC